MEAPCCVPVQFPATFQIVITYGQMLIDLGIESLEMFSISYCLFGAIAKEG